MNLTQTLFSFNGRIRRSTFWLYSIALGVVFGVVYVVGTMLMVNGGAMMYVGGILMLAVWIAYIWGALALYVKRLHDKDMMWAWIFCPIYPAIVAMFLDGTQGPNKYGPSPKGITGPAVAST
jgi:uncharacterized membrane protein YhaH (DUF805 family)